MTSANQEKIPWRDAEGKNVAFWGMLVREKHCSFIKFSFM